MPHPFFDALTFPWHRPEAIACYRALCAAIPQPARIDLLYRRSGSDLPPLNVAAAPGLIWFDALNNLTASHCLRRFCDLLLVPDLATLAPYVTAIQTAVADPDQRPSAAERATTRLDAQAALNRVLAELYPLVDDSRRLVAMSGLPADLIAFHNAPGVNWFNILQLASTRPEGIESLVRATLTDRPNVPDLIMLAKSWWPNAL